MMAHIFITATGDCSIVQGCCFLRMYIPHISDIKKIYVVAMQSTRNDMEMPEFQELLADIIAYINTNTIQ